MAWPGKSGASSKHGPWQSLGNSITQRLVGAISYTVMSCSYLTLKIRSFLGIQRPCKHFWMLWHIRLILRGAAPTTSSAVTTLHKTPKLLSLQRQTGHPHSAREISGNSILLHSSMDMSYNHTQWMPPKTYRQAESAIWILADSQKRLF